MADEPCEPREPADKPAPAPGEHAEDLPPAEGALHAEGPPHAEDPPRPARGGNGERLASQRELLGEMRALRRQARGARHAYWFPLVLFGLLTCASIPFYVQPPFRQDPPGSGIFVRAGAVHGPSLPFLSGLPGQVQNYLAYYWIAALLVGLLATQLWYWWHARRVGLATPARGYVIVTAVLAVAAIVIPPLSDVRSPHSLRFLQRLHALWPGDLVVRGTFPLLIVAVGLLALAWSERSRVLALTAVIYTGAALLATLYNVSNLTARIGWTPGLAEETLPNVLLPAAVLLIAGTASFAAARRHRATA
jgi:hypothetical protein